MIQSTCTHCASTFEYEARGHGRGRKFCSKRCSSADSRERLRAIAKPCTRDDCGKPIIARGLCGTHYNQTNPNRHKKITVSCSGCGALTEKDSSCTRWNKTHCSDICRVWSQYGIGWSVKIPKDHWARMYGATCQWPRHKRGATSVQHPTECKWCGESITGSRSGTGYCTLEHRRRAKGVRRRGREHGATGTFTWMDVTRLWTLFDRACAYCATPTPLTEIQAEHVVALSNGGANNLSNLLPSCGACNSDKRDLMLEDWNADRTRRGLPPVRTEWDESDTRYQHLAIGHRLAA